MATKKELEEIERAIKFAMEAQGTSDKIDVDGMERDLKEARETYRKLRMSRTFTPEALMKTFNL